MASQRPADRAAAAKAAALKKQMAADLLAKAAKDRGEIDDLAFEAELLIEAVLARYADEDYPDIEYLDAYIPSRGAWRVIGRTRPTRAGAYRLLEYSWPESRSRVAGIAWMHVLGAYGYLLVAGEAYPLPEFAAKVKKHEGVDRDAQRNPYEPFTLPTFRQIVEALTTLAKAPPRPAPAPPPPPAPKTRIPHKPTPRPRFANTKPSR